MTASHCDHLPLKLVLHSKRKKSHVWRNHQRLIGPEKRGSCHSPHAPIANFRGCGTQRTSASPACIARLPKQKDPPRSLFLSHVAGGKYDPHFVWLFIDAHCRPRHPLPNPIQQFAIPSLQWKPRRVAQRTVMPPSCKTKKNAEIEARCTRSMHRPVMVRCINGPVDGDVPDPSSCRFACPGKQSSRPRRTRHCRTVSTRDSGSSPRATTPVLSGLVARHRRHPTRAGSAKRSCVGQ